MPIRGLLALAVSIGVVLFASACTDRSATPTSVTSGPIALADDQPVEHQFGLPPHAVEATIEHIVDGDTVTVTIGGNTETLRLLGIDTPEKPGGPRPAECHGQAATDLAAELLPVGTRVLLARDEEPRDLYGRLLTYVYRAEDELFINLTMVEHGAAAPLSITPNDTFADLFAQSAAVARQANRGLWGACGRPDLVLDQGPLREPGQNR